MSTESGQQPPVSFEKPKFTSQLLRVRAWLIALTIVPLLGAMGLVTAELDQVRESRTGAETVSAVVGEMVALGELRSHLLDERNWAAARAGVVAIGATEEQAEMAIGIDLEFLERTSAWAVDAYLDELGWAVVKEDLGQVRRDVNAEIEDKSLAYERIAASVDVKLERALDELLLVVGRSGGDLDPVTSFRLFAAASEARQSMTLQLTGYLGARFGGSTIALRDLVALRDQDIRYQQAMSSVDRTATQESRVKAVLDDVNTSNDVEKFRSAVADVVANSKPVSVAEDFDVVAIMSQIDAIQAEVQAWAAAVEAHGLLVEAAVADVFEQSAAVDQAADDDAGVAYERIGLLLLTSGIFALGVARAIGRPLRRLADGAQDLRDGSAAEPLKPSGPTEIREAMLAINEASAHIELVERQAKVLADGRLDDEVLNERAPGALGESLQSAVQTLAGSLTESEELRRRLAHEATHDGLTQLANRKASLAQLEKSLARTSRTGGMIAVMFIDLDGFKDINDNHGHSVGDAVLWTLGKRLVKALRAGDHVGRLGGDEFLVIAEPVSGADEAQQLADRLARSIAQPMDLGTRTISITVSIGVALADGVNGLTATELLHDADLAVYRAKELGRSRIELCDEALHQEIIQRSVIEDALRRAIPGGEFTMHFQPILCARTAELSSLEALIRWDRPGFGFFPPDQFIPVAERTSLIGDIDNWVIGHVVEQLKTWADDPVLGSVPISMNISGRHLSSNTFVEDILGPIADAGVDPSRLILEITESALLHDLDSAARKLQVLRDQRIKIAIDDFGTGYTSLGHLRSLPIDILKIDRSFIDDKSARSLVKLIIDTGHLIGASITSEGIETVEQASQFTELGSDALQGFLFARPMPAADVETELATKPANRFPFFS